MEAWFRQLVQKSNWTPTVTMQIGRDELVTLLACFEAFEWWDHKCAFEKKTIFQHSCGKTVRRSTGSIIEISNEEPALETLKSIFENHDFEVDMNMTRICITPSKLESVVKLKQVEVEYSTQFQKKKWMYDIGLKYRAASLGGIERMICTKQGPADHFVRIRHSDWANYYGTHTTVHTAASLTLKFQDILALLK
jgi:hypothetical protein